MMMSSPLLELHTSRLASTAKRHVTASVAWAQLLPGVSFLVLEGSFWRVGDLLAT